MIQPIRFVIEDLVYSAWKTYNEDYFHYAIYHDIAYLCTIGLGERDIWESKENADLGLLLKKRKVSMTSIPITFEYSGQTVKTFLGPFHEFDLETYYMGDGMKYFGRLQKMNDDYGFLPYTGSEALVEMQDYFRDVVVAWYQ